MAQGVNHAYDAAIGMVGRNDDPMGLHPRFDELEDVISSQGDDVVVMRPRRENNTSPQLPQEGQNGVARPVSGDLNLRAQKHLADLKNELENKLEEQTFAHLGQTDGIIRVKFSVECGSALVLQISRSFAGTTKVEVLKRMLEIQVNIPAYFQAWYLGNQELGNTDTLGGRNIQDNNVIRVVELYCVRE